MPLGVALKVSVWACSTSDHCPYMSEEYQVLVATARLSISPLR